MKKYLLFAGEEYYPAEGVHDFINAHDTIEEAKAHVTHGLLLDGRRPDWAQIAVIEGDKFVIKAVWGWRHGAMVWEDIPEESSRGQAPDNT